MNDPALDLPVIRIYVRTYEAGGKERQASMAISTMEWDLATTKAVHLLQVEKMLDEAADAANEAHQVARLAGPKGRLP